MNSSEEDTLFHLFFVDVSRDFASVLFHPFLDQTETTNYHWYSRGIRAPRSLNFSFCIFIL